MTIIIGVVIIILLVIIFIQNYQSMKVSKNQGQKHKRYTIMVGIDLFLNVLISFTLILKMIS